MKLMIRQEYFDLIKAGKKPVEWRDAHLTLVSEETGESLRVDVSGAHVFPKCFAPEEYHHLFEDEKVIAFYLDEGSVPPVDVSRLQDDVMGVYLLCTKLSRTLAESSRWLREEVGRLDSRMDYLDDDLSKVRDDIRDFIDLFYSLHEHVVFQNGTLVLKNARLE